MPVKGYRNLIVIGAPKVVLRHSVTRDRTALADVFDVQKLCLSLSIPFVEAPHDDIDVIAKARASIGAKIAIIAGARILKSNIISEFPRGVVESHPGKIPETSGLDSFFYTLKTGSSMGVTVHLIDERVDAEVNIFRKLRITAEDTYDSIKNNLYLTQLVALHRFLDVFLSDDMACKCDLLPKKNSPLDAAEKEAAKDGFDAWKARQIEFIEEIENKFFEACLEGRLAEIKQLVSEKFVLLSRRILMVGPRIIIAAFWQHESVVNYLVKMGANPNDRGNNGTTVLRMLRQNY